MPSFRTVRRVAHSPERMFDLVADVERYPEFLPFCKSLNVKRRSTDTAGVETVVAGMNIGYKAINESFTSRVKLDRAKLRIVAEYVDGPFSFLDNRWSFMADTSKGPNGAAVEFYITYEFKSRMLQMLAGAVFDRIFRIFSEAFEARADEVYGAAGLAPRAATGG
ncbi:MAG: type II toxin-antitoxin system RatA family toxin [Bosea sp. (in: a-proteobacteria)]